MTGLKYIWCYVCVVQRKQNRQNIHRNVSMARFDFVCFAEAVQTEPNRIASDRTARDRTRRQSHCHRPAELSVYCRFFACAAITFQQQQIVWHIFLHLCLLPISLLSLFAARVRARPKIKSTAFKIPFWCCDKRVTYKQLPDRFLPASLP